MKKKKRRKLAPGLPHRDIAFVFKQSDQVGAAGAELDQKYLSTCYVDTGALGLLEDLNDYRQIVLGRTGTGKSALLAEIAKRNGNHAIQISPEHLALTYVSNSTILRFFSSAGVNLDPLFKLLWRHVLTVEVLRRYFTDHVEPKSTASSFSSWILGLFSGTTRDQREKKEAIEYLRIWGERFWEETEFRVKEITKKFENELTASVKAHFDVDFASAEASLGTYKKLSEEQKGELHERAQRVVSRAQIQDLTKVISVLDSLLSDYQSRYYLLIDSLDTDWVEDKIRYRLIMALLVTIRDMSRVTNSKSIVAMRRDLIERVFRICRGAGFQEEKFQSLYLPLVWDKDTLIRVLDRRVAEMARSRTGRAGMTHKDFLPATYRTLPIADYITQRATRPRDVIAFFNACIGASIGKSRVQSEDLQRAEGEYSRSRLKALGDEWKDDYPSLLDVVKLIVRRPASFKISTISDQHIQEWCLTVAVQEFDRKDGLLDFARQVAEGNLTPRQFAISMVHIFYKIGLVGLKTESFESESWVDELGRGVSLSDIDDDTSVVVHMAYHRALGIRN